MNAAPWSAIALMVASSFEGVALLDRADARRPDAVSRVRAAHHRRGVGAGAAVYGSGRAQVCRQLHARVGLKVTAFDAQRDFRPTPEPANVTLDGE